MSPFYKRCEMFYLQTQVGMPTYLPHDEYIQKIRVMIEQNISDTDFRTKIVTKTKVEQSSNSKLHSKWMNWDWYEILDVVENYLA